MAVQPTQHDPVQDMLLLAIDNLNLHLVAKTSFIDIVHISTSSYYLNTFGRAAEANVTLISAGERPHQLYGMVSALTRACLGIARAAVTSRSARHARSHSDARLHLGLSTHLLQIHLCLLVLICQVPDALPPC